MVIQANNQGLRPCYLRKSRLPTVWGTNAVFSPEDAEVMLRGYIDFEQDEQGELVCRLGSGKEVGDRLVPGAATCSFRFSFLASVVFLLQD